MRIRLNYNGSKKQKHSFNSESNSKTTQRYWLRKKKQKMGGYLNCSQAARVYLILVRGGRRGASSWVGGQGHRRQYQLRCPLPSRNSPYHQCPETLQEQNPIGANRMWEDTGVFSQILSPGVTSPPQSCGWGHKFSWNFHFFKDCLFQNTFHSH